MNTTVIIALIIIGTASFVGIVGVLISTGIRRFKQSLIGSIFSGIANELNASGKNLSDVDFSIENQPKSVSDMSSALIPSIAKDFPELNVRQMASACEQLLTEYLTAIRTGSSLEPEEEKNASRSLYSDGSDKADLPIQVTDAFRASLRQRIDNLKEQGKSECFSGIKIHRSGIRSYEKNSGTRAITFQTALEYLHYIKQNDNVIFGDLNVLRQARYNIEVIYVMDENKLAMRDSNSFGMVCQSCGAPVRTIGNKVCEFCGVSLTPVDMRLWRADRITES
jgi:rRNA maturation endonuclease Nob1